MKAKILFFISVFVYLTNYAQVGIGTINPEGALDINSSNMGIILPRVTKVEDVTDGNGNDAPNGAVVYDTSRNNTCYRIDGKWVCTGIDGSGNPSSTVIIPNESQDITYIKASNTEINDYFGTSVSINGDGTLLAVGAYQESSNATGINGDQTNNTASKSGAVYIFSRSGTTWTQEAYIKASNTEANDYFGRSLHLSNDGTRLVVGASAEDSNATGINGDETNNSASSSGAVYVFTRSGTTWAQEAYIKASNTGSGDSFGYSVFLSSDASRLVVGSIGEDSNATGINGDETNNSASSSGAVYVFTRSGITWSQEAYIKPSNTGNNDYFGRSLSATDDASRLIIGAYREDSNATGVNGNETDNSASDSGAAYIFSRSGTTWTQEAYIKASNTNGSDYFGISVSISGDGTKVAVGAIGEDSNAVGISGNEADNSVSNSGAVYVFTRSGTTWSQNVYMKASNTGLGDSFGNQVSLNSDGSRLAVGAYNERSAFKGVNANQNDDTASGSGAAYIFNYGGSWAQTSYIKSSNSETNDTFSQYQSLSNNGLYFVGSSFQEDSNATGINGDQNDNSFLNSGAVYIVNPL